MAEVYATTLWEATMHVLGSGTEKPSNSYSHKANYGNRGSKRFFFEITPTSWGRLKRTLWSDNDREIFQLRYRQIIDRV
jgi:hypothetical protein